MASKFAKQPCLIRKKETNGGSGHRTKYLNTEKIKWGVLKDSKYTNLERIDGMEQEERCRISSGSGRKKDEGKKLRSTPHL